ncbi:hypothetical protein [Pseudomonas palleroniana]|uniref:hypothetical protein n=1 Tax=Pseudomonas palleroniana TaxID=191390 RepID=UPI0018E668F1|nr:hypothetical protein [Pseudomonas palleroniana]MBI6911690.1 hypothetical protein [Pseudomonas palleroniana]
MMGYGSLTCSVAEARSLSDVVGNRAYLDSSKDASTVATTSFVQRWNSSGPSVFAEVTGYDLNKQQYAPKNALLRPMRVVVSLEDLSSSLQVNLSVSKNLNDIYAIDAAASINPDISRYAVRKGIDVVEDYIELGDFHSLNELLARAKPEMMRRVTAVALLRTAYRLRGKLSKWMRFYTEVFAHLEATHQDPQRALKGLVRSRV